MKKYICIGVLIFASLYAHAQNVAINTDGTPASDPKAMLEIKKSVYSKLKVRSLSFSDTAVLELSNRTASELGTDFLFSNIREQALVLSSRSDLTANNVDSLMTISPQGNTRFRSLRGTGSRPVVANANGEISAAETVPVIHYLSIPAVDFQPRFPTSATQTYTSMDANIMASFAAGSTNYAAAPVKLPDGAVVTSFKAYFYDNSTTADLVFQLFVSGFTEFGGGIMANVTSSGSVGGPFIMSTLEDNTINFSTIDNSANTYLVQTGPPTSGCCWDGSNLRFKGVLITYTLD